MKKPILILSLVAIVALFVAASTTRFDILKVYQIGYSTNASFAPDFNLGYSMTNVGAAYTLQLPLNVDTGRKLGQTAVFMIGTNGSGTTPFLLTTPVGATGSGVPYLTNTTIVTVFAYGNAFTQYNYLPIK